MARTLAPHSRPTRPRAQVCAFRTDSRAAGNLGQLVYSSNQLLPAEVRIQGAALVPDSFDPRDNRGKEYRYRLSVSPRADPLLDGARAQRWHLPPRRGAPQWDAAAAARAAALLRGSHCFAAFANSPRGSERVAAAAAAAAGSPAETVCRIRMLQLRQLGEGDYVFRVRGDRFNYKMVRNIVGALVKVGHGEISEAEMADALELGAFARSASLALTAPPHGLVLRHVLFGGSAPDAPDFFGVDGAGEAGRRGLRPWRACTVAPGRLRRATVA